MPHEQGKPLWGVCKKLCNLYYTSVHVNSVHLVHFYNFLQFKRYPREPKFCLISKVLSKETAYKYPSSGLKFELLSLAYAKNETELLRSMLSEKFRELVRVTKTKGLWMRWVNIPKKSNLIVLLSFELSFMCSYCGPSLLVIGNFIGSSPWHKMLSLILQLFQQSYFSQ